MNKTTLRPGLIAGVCALSLLPLGAKAQGGGGASGGGGGAVGGGGAATKETIKVTKQFYVASNGALLVNCASSVAAAHIFVYLPDGRILGEVQNGASKYGGTVFFAGMKDPKSFTLKSTAGTVLKVPTVPYHP